MRTDRLRHTVQQSQKLGVLQCLGSVMGNQCTLHTIETLTSGHVCVTKFRIKTRGFLKKNIFFQCLVQPFSIENPKEAL